MNSLRKVCSAAAIVPRHARRFGGDRRYRHPEIYSPAGGWWNTNPNAKRNTLIAAGVIASIATPIALTSMQLEYRPLEPTRTTITGRFARGYAGDPNERLSNK
eukprot:CAMPEP_0195519640 /NCGR_PEP_ID=MMETSP0794_2-20130614/15185_1 /TAXON_ID=515487 /ORGANISM="Stephanopyxis turris, Strain CCMP 815" /LENGTH=102 /DNA_ID=CAMNT_0040648829 /DNA_START=39 /DNA_END=347 /DNA_ORIENTATION=-